MNVNELMYDLEECKLEVESVLWEIVCDKRGVESVEDLDDRLLLVECMDDFYGGDNWELFKWWMETMFLTAMEAKKGIAYTGILHIHLIDRELYR